MALELQDNVPGKRSETESLALLAGSHDCMLIDAGETLDGLDQNIRIISLTVNETAVLSSLIADDQLPLGTEVLTGVTKGLKNLNGMNSN